MPDVLDSLADRFPKQSRLIRRVKKLAANARALERIAFIEPVSLQVIEQGGKPTLTALGPTDFNAWRLHVAEGCTVRMEALEDGIFSELANGRITSAMIVARAHMEVAGLAAQTLARLYDAAERGTWMDLAPAIQRTYFGSSMRIQAQGTPSLNELIGMGEVYPSKPTDFVRALDRFVAPSGQPGTKFQVVYGLLSEYAHPAMRGNKAFVHSEPLPRGGWIIEYGQEEKLAPRAVRMAFEIVRDNMRAGYGACGLLRLVRIDVEDGDLTLARPTPREFRPVWRNFIR